MRTIRADELKSKMAEHSNLIVVNALEAHYYDDCHIKGSMSVPLHELEIIAKSWDKNEEIIVYCAQYSCHVSKKAYMMLDGMGFTNVYAYEGGIKEWVEKGFATEGPCKLDYLKK